MKLYRFTDFATWCIIIMAWSILIAIAAGTTLYIEHLESTLQSSDLVDLGRVHVIEIVVSHSIFWLAGLACAFGCMKRSALAQQEASDELRHSCEDLAEKNAELARFVYTVSHDLKSPLVTIKGYIGLMLDNIADESYAETQQNAVTISRAADRMQQLLDELLRLSRIGRIRSDYVCKTLNKLLEEVLMELDGLCDGSHSEIIVQPGMPILCGDEIRLKELLQNLIENAIKHAGDRDNPRVEITGWVEDNEIVCCVSDNGIGIEEAYFEKVFDLFEKLDPDTPGSGVGLAVAKRIVEVHHGRIWCESEGPNTGSKFCFSIPRVSCEPV